MRLVIEGQGVDVLTDEVGSGKSTLVRGLCSELDHLLYTNVYNSLSDLRPKDFYAELVVWVDEALITLNGGEAYRNYKIKDQGDKSWGDYSTTLKLIKAE